VDICPHTSTIEKLVALLNKKGVVLVRGTLVSGKTTLAHLLWGRYRKRREPAVFINGWHAVNDTTSHLISKCKAAGINDIEPEDFADTPIVLIIDEA